MQDDRRFLFRARWAAIGAAIAVTIGAGGLWVAHAASTGASSFVPMTPCRLIDTRPGVTVGPRSTPLGAGETATFTVTGFNGNCLLPLGVNGVAANVTTVDGSSTSFLTIWPADAPRPNASTNNWVAGQAATPNKVDVRVSPYGRISVFNLSGTVNLVIDLVGYYENVGVSGHQMVSKPVTLPANGFVADSVACPVGKVPVGGGFQLITDPPPGVVRMLQSYSSANSWFAVAENSSATSLNAAIQVICLSV